jgi:translation initiation factor IF-1
MSDQEQQGQEDLRKAGEVLEALPSFKFRVKLESGEEILAYVSGKLRMHRIRILPGDKVTVETNPYDAKRGRIVYRGK